MSPAAVTLAAAVLGFFVITFDAVVSTSRCRRSAGVAPVAAVTSSRLRSTPVLGGGTD